MATGGNPSPGGGRFSHGCTVRGGGPSERGAGLGIARFSGVCAEKGSAAALLLLLAARRISVFFFRSRCAGHSQHRGPSVISQTAAGDFFSPTLPAGVFGVSPTHQHGQNVQSVLDICDETNSTMSGRSSRQVKPAGQQVNGHHQASQGPLNLTISWPGSRGCVSVSECRQTMPAAMARWSVSATNATTARIILRECLGHHRISAPHPQHVEIKYHLSLFSIFNSPFPAQMESKSRRGQSVVRVHGVGPRQELSLKPSPLCPPSSAATRSRTVCRGGNR